MRSWRRDLLAGAVCWVAFTGVEVVLVGKIDAQETPVGAVIAVGAAAASVVALRVAGARYRLRAAWLFLPFRLARNVVRDTLLVFGALFRRLATGALPDDRIERVPFEPGGDDAESAARRALVIAGVSLSPNGMVVDIDAHDGALLIHRLTPDPAPPLSREWPL